MSSHFLILKNQIPTQSHKSGQAGSSGGTSHRVTEEQGPSASLAEAAGYRRGALGWREFKSEEVFILKPRYTPLFPNILALKNALFTFILVIEFLHSDITFILLISLAGPKKQRKTTKGERLEISSRILEIPRENFMQRWAQQRTKRQGPNRKSYRDLTFKHCNVLLFDTSNK